METDTRSLHKSFLTVEENQQRGSKELPKNNDQQDDAFQRGLKRGIWRISIFMLYCLVACLFYCNYEGWTIKGALFFTVITMSSVGYGYRHPSDDNSRLFTMFFLIFGVYFIYVGITVIVSERVRTASKLLEQNNTIELMGMQISNYKRMMIWNLIGILLMLIIGAGIGMSLEGWSFIEALYFALQTATTVGYGDLAITNEATYIFVGIFIVFSTILFGVAVNNFQMLKAQEQQMVKLKQMNIKKKDLRFLEELDTGTGISQEQFVLALLVHLGTLDADRDVKPWLEVFKDLDVAGDGKVNRETLHQFSERESEIADINLHYARASEHVTNPLSLFFNQQRITSGSTTSSGVDMTVRSSQFTTRSLQRSTSHNSDHTHGSNETA